MLDTMCGNTLSLLSIVLCNHTEALAKQCFVLAWMGLNFTWHHLDFRISERLALFEIAIFPNALPCLKWTRQAGSISNDLIC